MFMRPLARQSPEGPGLNSARTEAEPAPSVLGRGMRIEGVLEIDGELVVSGLVKGRIAAVKVVLAADGIVEGDIIAREVVILGRLTGRVFAPNVAIEASAEVEGRIFHTTVTVARGARVTARMPWRPVSYFENLDKLPEIRP
jgi:cytoskeletal protein CcmA (bactofilin family)